MSYSIYRNDHLVFEYQARVSNPFVQFYDTTLENDVKEGLSVPYYLRSEFNGRVIVPYPPKGEDIKVFAEVYRRSYFDTELVKHGFTIKEETSLPIHKKA